MVNNRRMCARWTVRGLVLASIALVVLLGFLSGCHLFTRTVRQLAQPTNVSATDGVYPDMVRVTWASVDGATGYEIQRATGQNAPYSKIGQTTDTTFNDTDVTLGIVYWYRVRARAAGEFGPRSEPASGYPEEADLQAPSAPTSISATRGDHTNKVVVSWDAMEFATSYEVYRKDDQEDSYKQVGTSSGTSYDDTNVSPGSTYWYRTRACGEAGCSGFSPDEAWGFAAEAPPGDEPPIAPRVLNATEGAHNNKVRLDWTASAAATYYEVYRADDDVDVAGYTRVGTSSSTAYDDAHEDGDNVLDPCKVYWYRVRACNDMGCSGLADSRTAQGYRGKVMGDVSPPGDLSASYRAHDNRIEVGWDQVPGAIEYTLQFRNGATWTDLTKTEKTSYTHKYTYDSSDGVPEAELAYFYRVQACGEGVCGCTSFSPQETGVRAGRPAAPDLTAIVREAVNNANGDEVQTYSVTLHWKWTWEPEQSPNPVDTFVIERRKVGVEGFRVHRELDPSNDDVQHDDDEGEEYPGTDALKYEPDDPDDDPIEVEYAFKWTETITVSATTTYAYRVTARREFADHVVDSAERVSNTRQVTLLGP